MLQDEFEASKMLVKIYKQIKLCKEYLPCNWDYFKIHLGAFEITI